MPGESSRVLPSTLDQQEEQIRQSLQQDLLVLAQDIGERNVSQRYRQLVEAAEFIERTLREAGK